MLSEWMTYGVTKPLTSCSDIRLANAVLVCVNKYYYLYKKYIANRILKCINCLRILPT